MNTSTDEELILTRGSEAGAALAELFARHHHRAHSLCFRMTGDSSIADDLVQESFLRVMKYQKTFDGRSRFTTWLYRLVRNVCLDHLARIEKERQMNERLTLEARIRKDLSKPDDRIELLHKALYRLTPEKREVIVLSRFHGFSYAEIAEVLECSLSAVKTRAHRAMRDLHVALRELESEV